MGLEIIDYNPFMPSMSKHAPIFLNSLLNLDASIFGFALNNSSEKFGVSLEMKWAARFRPSP